MFKFWFTKAKTKAFGGALDYMDKRNNQGGYSGAPFDSGSKFDNGLVNYEQPSSINIDKLRSQSRKALIDSPELIALARTLKVLVIGDGLKVNSAPERTFLPELSRSTETSIKEHRKTIDTLWEMCADSTSFDALGERNLACLMQDGFEKWMQDGEVVILFSVETDPEKLKRSLTPIRVSFALPDVLCSPKKNTQKDTGGNLTIDGIELDKSGAPIAYWVNKQRIEKFSPNTGRVMVSILKNGQTLRGIPPFACAIQEAKLLQDYQLAEVQKMALGSQIFMTAVENQDEMIRKANASLVKKNSGVSSEPEEIVKLSRNGVNLLKVSNHGQFSSLDTPKPTPGFTDFTQTVQKRICMTLGMSRDIVSKDVNSSYSAARFQAQLTELEISTYRMRFVDTFVRPLYENWFRFCVQADQFTFVKNFSNLLEQKSWMAIEVIGRPMPDLSPLQEAKAMQTYLEMGILSRSDITKMMGYPKWEDTANTLESEKKVMDKLSPIPADSSNNFNYKATVDN